MPPTVSRRHQGWSKSADCSSTVQRSTRHHPRGNEIVSWRTWVRWIKNMELHPSCKLMQIRSSYIWLRGASRQKCRCRQQWIIKTLFACLKSGQPRSSRESMARLIKPISRRRWWAVDCRAASNRQKRTTSTGSNTRSETSWPPPALRQWAATLIRPQFRRFSRTQVSRQSTDTKINFIKSVFSDQ